MSTSTTLILAQQYITRYVLSTVYALGTLGNLTAMIIFSQKKHRTNSCSIYLLAMSTFGFMATHVAIAPLVYALDHFDLVNSSTIACRIRGYTLQVSSTCFRYTLVLMCADRYALCNSRASVRALCRPQIAYRSITILTIFWTVASSHLLIWESIENNQCSVYGLYGNIMGFYIFFLIGIIPISSMTVISILIRKSLRQLRARVQPINSGRRMKRRDIQLMKLVLVEVITYILCASANPLMYIYASISNSIISKKTVQRIQIEAFSSFIAMSVLTYTSYNIMFFVHILTSKTYRMEVKELVLKMCRKLTQNTS